MSGSATAQPRVAGHGSSPGPEMTTRSARQWAGAGFWAIADQGLFAVSNFVLNIVLARWLVPEAYGAFALAFSLFLLVSTVHTALLTEPMLVFGPGTYRESFEKYVGVLIREHWKLSCLLGALLAATGAGLWMQSPLIALAVWAVGAATPFLLLQWLLRRACYVRLQPRIASLAGLGYSILLISGAYALHEMDVLSPFSAFALMGLASFAAAAWLAHRLGLPLAPRRDDLVRQTRIQHWSYGRWAVGAAVLTWVPGNVYYVLLPIWGGLEATGTLRALVNLVTPIIHTNVALSLVLLPALVSVRGTPAFKQRVTMAALVLCSGAILYWVALGYLHQPVLRWLYDGKYAADASTLWLLGLLGVASAVVAVCGAALRAMARPDRVFWAYMGSSLVAVIAGVSLISLWQVRGAAIGMVLSAVATAVGLAWHLGRQPLGEAADDD